MSCGIEYVKWQNKYVLTLVSICFMTENVDHLRVSIIIFNNDIPVATTEFVIENLINHMPRNEILSFITYGS